MQSRAVEKDAATLERAAPQERVQRIHVPLLNGGINVDKAPGDLADNEVVECRTLHIVSGRLVVDTGYVPFSQTFLGFPQAALQVLFPDSSTVELLITSLYVYRYESAVAQWQLASFNSIRVTTLGYPAGSTLIAIDDDSDIVIGQLVGVMLDNGVQHITTVADLPAPGVVELTDPIPVGRSVALGAEFAVGVTLSGDPSLSQVCWVFYAGNAWIIFSNGIDPIMYYEGGAVIELGGLPVNTTCAAMAVFHGMLLLGNTTENGTHLPNRVRQSDIGDPEGWSPGTNGVAAIYDLIDTPDYIFNLKTLGPWICCYREASVMRGSFIGALNEILLWEYMSQQDGVQSQGAVADVGAGHVIVGTNNVYLYQGDYTLPPIGEAIFDNFLDKDGDLYAPAKATLFCVYVPTLREVWIMYPSSEIAPAPAVPDFPNKLLRYNTTLRAWQDRVFADEFIAAGQYVQHAAITWATAQGAWNSTIWERPWTSRINVANVPNVFLCPATQNQLFIYDFTALTDGGATIEFTVTTKQYGDGSVFTRWERATFTFVGAAQVDISIDEGVNWTELGQLDNGFFIVGAQTLWLDLTSTRLQFRLHGQNGFFELRYFDIYAEFDSEW